MIVLPIDLKISAHAYSKTQNMNVVSTWSKMLGGRARAENLEPHCWRPIPDRFMRMASQHRGDATAVSSFNQFCIVDEFHGRSDRW